MTNIWLLPQLDSLNPLDLGRDVLDRVVLFMEARVLGFELGPYGEREAYSWRSGCCGWC